MKLTHQDNDQSTWPLGTAYWILEAISRTSKTNSSESQRLAREEPPERNNGVVTRGVIAGQQENM